MDPQNQPPKAPKAPPAEAPMADHKRHAEEFLKIEGFKKKPANLDDQSDEARP